MTVRSERLWTEEVRLITPSLKRSGLLAESANSEFHNAAPSEVWTRSGSLRAGIWCRNQEVPLQRVRAKKVQTLAKHARRRRRRRRLITTAASC